MRMLTIPRGFHNVTWQFWNTYSEKVHSSNVKSYTLHFRQTPTKSDLLWEVDLVQQWWKSFVWIGLLRSSQKLDAVGKREEEKEGGCRRAAAQELTEVIPTFSAEMCPQTGLDRVKLIWDTTLLYTVKMLFCFFHTSLPMEGQKAPSEGGTRHTVIRAHQYLSSKVLHIEQNTSLFLYQVVCLYLQHIYRVVTHCDGLLTPTG